MSSFTVIEGIDGSGKSAIVNALRERLKSEEVIFTEEPTNSWLGDAVRRSHDEKANPLTETFLFLADRSAHAHEIEKWLSEGKQVICDRYYHSTVAYQGAALDGKVDFDPFSWLLEVNRQIAPEPDIVFLLDVAPSISLDRIIDREALSKFEREDFLEKVAGNYSKLAELLDNIIVIDASEPLEEVLRNILDEL